MPKFIIKPGQRVTHNSVEAAQVHFAKMAPGQPFSSFPPVPAIDYYEGDEIELSEDEAAQIPHAVCTPEEFEQQSSPKALIAKGYTRDEAESMVAGMRESMAARAKERKAAAARRAIPGGMAPTDGSTEVNPRVAGKIPDKDHKKHE